jgi:hypothetical protein
MFLNSLKAAKMLVSARMKTHPSLFVPFAWFRENDKRVLVRPNSDLVISGYWRCANHYAAYAFILAQQRPVHVAHHFHAPAQVMLAMRWKVPVLVLIREPVGAVSSATVFLQHDDPAPFLKFYNIFYGALLPYRDRVVISEFDRTTHDFKSVIAEINERFGRDFMLYQGTPDEEERVREMIAKDTSLHDVAMSPLPSPEREPLKEKIRQQLLAPRCASLLKQAQRYYDLFVTASRGV